MAPSRSSSNSVGHVGLELVRMRRSARGDAVEKCAAAVEQEAQCVPKFQPEQAEPRRNQAFAPDRHGLRAIADQQATVRQAGEGTAKMRATDSVERGVHAGPASWRPAVSRRTVVTKSPAR